MAIHTDANRALAAVEAVEEAAKEQAENLTLAALATDAVLAECDEIRRAMRIPPTRGQHGDE